MMEGRPHASVSSGLLHAAGEQEEARDFGRARLHQIMDNYCTHKSAEVQRWLKPKRRSRYAPLPFSLHTDQQFEVESSRTILCVEYEWMIRRGTFLSATELEQAIYHWLAQWNGSPKPFV
jgi:hypothetical protein